MINDVSMLADPDMARTAAELDVPLAIGHTRPKAQYEDVTTEVTADLQAAVERAVDSGVSRDRLLVDPGIGFGKKAPHSLELLDRLQELRALRLPVLIGTSRKSFIGEVLDLPVEERLEGTAATVALSISRGADTVRVHDVPEMVRVARMCGRGRAQVQTPARSRGKHESAGRAVHMETFAKPPLPAGEGWGEGESSVAEYAIGSLRFPGKPGVTQRSRVTETSLCYIGLGSNLGDRSANLAEARRQLAGIGRIVSASSVYETEPWRVDPRPTRLPQPGRFP